MSVEAEIHESLRTQGLVPEAEDMPFIACSTDYRTKMREACGDFEDNADRIRDLEYELKHEENARLDAEDEARDLRHEVHELEDDNARLQNELDKLRSENADLLARLEGKHDADHPT